MSPWQNLPAIGRKKTAINTNLQNMPKIVLMLAPDEWDNAVPVVVNWLSTHLEVFGGAQRPVTPVFVDASWFG